MIIELLSSISVWPAALFFLVAGCVSGWIGYRIYQASILKWAESTAQDIVDEVKHSAEMARLEEKERQQELEEELWTKEDKYLIELEARIENLEEMATEKKSKNDQSINDLKSRYGSIDADIKRFEKKVQELESFSNSKLQSRLDILKNYRDKLSQKLNEDPAELIQQRAMQLELETLQRSQKIAQKIEEDTKEHSETIAKSILSRALDRFQRPYSSERGISGVYFEHPDQRKILIDAKGENLKTVTEITGCDVIYQPENDLLGVAGFDPVRRELTRRLLEKLLKEKRPVTPDVVRKHGENQKREILRQIKHDGDQIAKELKLQNLHPEIRQMMGSLRFRYSFTQNQYFHCGEVGWLCGLLSQELGGVELAKARRAGTLHDLGKAMDHGVDGGHAVIGADFIQARNEAADVVHAIRAHHYDETPTTDLAFLVIAADAISGARPGARRSTIESYNQKVTELENIARSFDGVTDCFILSGGRECRVLVNSRKVDDRKALELSSLIAKRIEAECNYPGQIKVVIVRETTVTESTRVG